MPVTGYVNRKRMIPVIGWKVIYSFLVPVIWFKLNERVSVTGRV